MINYSDKYESEIKDILRTNPRNYMSLLKSKGKKNGTVDRTYLLNYIYECTQALNSDNFEYSLKTRIYWTINRIKSFDDPRVRCKVDGNPIINWNVVNINFDYKQTCCDDCERLIAQQHNEENMLKKYGVKNAFQLKSTKDKYNENKKDIRKKGIETKRENNTFNTSADEKIAEQLLRFAYNDVKTQYSSDKYPFNCDFYIPSIDTYIEFNGSWTHGQHAFDQTNDNDIQLLNEWKAKNSEYYNNAINTWTVRDVEKRQIAKDNNLNFIEVWTIGELVSAITNNIDNDLFIIPDKRKLFSEFSYFVNKDMLNKRIPLHNTHNLIVKFFQQNTFYKKEKELWNNPTIQAKLIKNRCKELDKNIDDLTVLDILDGFKKSGMHYGYSHFNPLIFKWFIQNNNVKSCYDPCGGWGHRLLGSNLLDLYIYNDLSISTKNNVDNIIKFFKISNTVTYCNDARTFIPTEKFDAMFTCPPYNNLEEYECGTFKDNNDFKKFIDSLFDVFQKSTATIFGLVIREDMLFGYNDFSEKHKITSEKFGHLTKQHKGQQEYLYIFKK